ncbi:hypothetical protein [Enterococcus malodoratus]|uniref:hypothetical protein n=1 Tax=Enterococcus malodoratus TaxID=71451 RepID=UPI0022DF0767|nr:hypothetical protein [Enterococcus malodoratus]
MTGNKNFKDVKKEWKLIVDSVGKNHYSFLVSALEQIRLFSYSKVLLNVTLTFIFPIILFSIPILLDGKSSFSDNMLAKLNSGVLFSTSISISATIISTYVDNAKTNIHKDQEKLKIKIIDKVLPLLIYSFLITILGAFFYGQVADGKGLNGYGMTIQICLYILVQIIYGVMDSKIKNSETRDVVQEQENYENQQDTKVEQGVNLLSGNNDIKNISNQKRV